VLQGIHEGFVSSTRKAFVKAVEEAHAWPCIIHCHLQSVPNLPRAGRRGCGLHLTHRRKVRAEVKVGEDRRDEAKGWGAGTSIHRANERVVREGVNNIEIQSGGM